MLRVVDENVLVVANDLTLVSLNRPVRCVGASDECRINCVRALEELIEGGGLILDDRSEYLEKYAAHANFSGQPGIGDAFMRLVYERGYDPGWATRVVIRNEAGYIIPQIFMDCGFHDDDFLWVAGAFNAPEEAEILNACDSDYFEHAADLAALPVSVRELCEMVV